ncbi:MAG: hypothetical protein ACKOD3_03400 [Phenylobacterium sp.]
MTQRDDRPPQDDEDAYSAWLERKREARKSSSAAEVRQRREADFPEALQGRWIDPDGSDTEVNIQGSQILWAGEPRPYIDKMPMVVEADEIYFVIVFPEDEEEDSQTGLYLMGDDLFFHSWHHVAGFVREEN